MIKEVVEIITTVFTPSDRLFMGNNGAGQYLIFAESLKKEEITAGLFQIQVLLEQKSKEKEYQIQLLSSFACAGEEQCRYIRQLLSIAMKRLGTLNEEKKS